MVTCSPLILPCSICERTSFIEKGPKSSLSFWISQRSCVSSTAESAASTLNDLGTAACSSDGRRGCCGTACGGGADDIGAGACCGGGVGCAGGFGGGAFGADDMAGRGGGVGVFTTGIGCLRACGAAPGGMAMAAAACAFGPARSAASAVCKASLSACASA